MRELTKDTVRQLISEILVYDRNRVEIHFKCKDEWENLLESTRIDLLQKKFYFFNIINLTQGGLKAMEELKNLEEERRQQEACPDIFRRCQKAQPVMRCACF